MISIIICSRNTDIPQSLKKNIKETIGIDHELVIIDNSNKKYSIFSAYNEGVGQAKFPYLVFMHDDILFHTKDWGEKVIDHFKDLNVGLIGVFGTHYLPCIPSDFWDSALLSSNFIYTVDSISKTINYKEFFNGNNFVEVVACDGFWLCLPRLIFEKIRFDDKKYSGFDFYDMDISMQVLNNNYSVRTINNILIEHFNESQLKKSYFENRTIFYNKWKNFLPVYRGIFVEESYKDLFDRFCELKIEYRSALLRNNQIINSKAYRIGKLISKPYTIIKNMLIST